MTSITRFAAALRTTRASAGQALVLFALFLIVLIGASALAIDYANWQLTDRQLQNIADHAALAGASQFSQDFATASCSSGAGSTQCLNARTQAWASLSQELGLGLNDTSLGTLGSRNSPAGGDTSIVQAGLGTIQFHHTIWVSTPPPGSSGGHREYTQVGGLYADSFGIIFVRVDRPTRTFFSSVFGISVRDRIGWATAGILPTDFALDVFCRNNVAPERGVCAAGGTSLGIEGGGGITLAHGDIGSSNSLEVTQQGGSGAIVKAGNVFLVNGTCGPSTWNCPPATLGGISDGSGTPKNAFYIPPLSVPSYALPTGTGSLPWSDTFSPNANCSSASVASPCIPVPAVSNYSTDGIDWACQTTDLTASNACGTSAVVTTAGVSTVTCTAHGLPTQDLRPNGDDSKSPTSGGIWNTQGGTGGSTMYNRLSETTIDPSGTTVPNPPAGPTTLSGTPSSFVYTKDGNTAPATYRVTLSSPNGTPSGGFAYVRWTLFSVKKSGGTELLDDAGGKISVTAQLQEKVGGTWVSRGLADTEVATGTAKEYQTSAWTDVTSITNPNALGILFTVTSTSTDHGAGISWAEAWLDRTPVPPPPPTIAPGQYRSVVIPDGGCAVLDPTGYESGGLPAFQMPGIYYFRDSTGGGQNATISLGQNSVLIGDGVTLVFDSNWPNPTGSGGSASAHGIELGTSSALVINSAISSTSDAACPPGSAAGTYNPSTPLPDLSHNAVCAAWEIDPSNPTTGVSPWGGPCAAACSLDRTAVYAASVNSSYRGVSFYFKPKTNLASASSGYSILSRFAMGGNVAGIAYRGILYAPYDDVQMSGANGFDTVGMVLAWTARFNGGSAAITLDYPYQRITAPPYLLEPTVQQ
ncbi:MAG TPA: pilus assembly protein TadG-related protein [Candidatus Limnocylindrales bacterium]